MAGFMEEYSGLVLLLSSLLITSLISIPILLFAKKIKPKYLVIIEKAKEQGTWVVGTEIHKKYHGERSWKDSNGHWRRSPGYWKVTYEYLYKDSIHQKRLKIYGNPPNEINLYYHWLNPRKLYALEGGRQPNGFFWYLPRISIFFVWIIVLIFLYAMGLKI